MKENVRVTEVANGNQQPEKFELTGKQKDLIFYVIMLAWPVLQFCVFYIGVNANSFLMAFQKIDGKGRLLEWTTQYMVQAWESLLGLDGTVVFLSAAKRSLQAYLIGLCISTPLGLLFSYYIYKRLPLSRTFRVILFLPSIISGIVMIAMYKFFVEAALPEIMTKLGHEMKIGLLSGRSPADVKFATVMVFNVWIGFGGGVLMYSNAMSGISQEIVDSAHLDGATGVKEFVFITLPSIFPTLSTFLITAVAGIFTNQAGLFSFFSNSAQPEIRTYGYEIYVRTLDNGTRGYPLVAAYGLYMTAVAVPLTYIVKWALEKFGPSVD